MNNRTQSRLTPGPWTEPRVYKDKDGQPYGIAIFGGGGRQTILATHGDVTPETLANFQAFSAVPDLVKALTDLIAANNCNYELEAMCSEGLFTQAEAALDRAGVKLK